MNKTASKPVKSINDLVLGIEYQLRDKAWFDKKKPSNAYHHNGAIQYAGQKVTIEGVVNGDQLILRLKNGREFWLGIEYVTEMPDQKKVSEEILTMIKRLKKENYLSTYDGGPGGGRSDVINTQKEPVLPCINKDGTECVYMNVSGLRRTFKLNKLEELFKTGMTSQSFKATEYTTITTELKLIKDKKNIPRKSSWETMSN